MPHESMKIAVVLQHPAPDWVRGDMALVVEWSDLLGETREERLARIPFRGPAELQGMAL